jgi:hypothetical protein
MKGEFMNLQKANDWEYGYIDSEGVSWASPLTWLWCGVLGGCGCGSSEDIEKIAWDVLDLFSQKHADRTWSVYDKLEFEIIAHWMDNKDLLEHGSSVAGSWLNEKGEEVHKILKGLLTRT